MKDTSLSTHFHSFLFSLTKYSANDVAGLKEGLGMTKANKIYSLPLENSEYNLGDIYYVNRSITI